MVFGKLSLRGNHIILKPDKWYNVCLIIFKSILCFKKRKIGKSPKNNKKRHDHMSCYSCQQDKKWPISITDTTFCHPYLKYQAQNVNIVTLTFLHFTQRWLSEKPLDIQISLLHLQCIKQPTPVPHLLRTLTQSTVWQPCSSQLTSLESYQMKTTGSSPFQVNIFSALY